jgi:hypothetical protein
VFRTVVDETAVLLLSWLPSTFVKKTNSIAQQKEQTVTWSAHAHRGGPYFRKIIITEATITDALNYNFKHLITAILVET